MVKTIRERLVEALELEGYQRVHDAKTRKYFVFRSPIPDGPGVAKKPLIYVGRAGALRGGLTVGSSIPYTVLRKRLLERVPA